MFPQCLCLLALLACVPLAHAQQHVYRCTGAHGEPVFSGQPCGTPAPKRNATTQPNGFGSVCAASPQELRQDIVAAFTTRDVNRLAGLILWRGLDQASALATLRSLGAWLQQSLSGITIAYANGPPLAGGEPLPPIPAGDPGGAIGGGMPPPVGFEVSTGDGNTRDFGVTEFGGCWWLTF